jgi:membrane dipeptidase
VRKTLCLLAFCFVGLAGHTQEAPDAQAIHEAALVWDAHSDIVQSIYLQEMDFSQLNDFSFQDIPRMKAGGLDVQIFAMLPDRMFFPRRSARRTLQLIDVMHATLEKYPEDLELARSASDIERITQEGKIAALLGIEGGHAIEDDLGLLRMYNRLGVTLMTLTHMNSNHWADAATDVSRADGLSAFGRKVVQEMNRLDMIIDVSHASDRTFFAVLETSSDPVIASHSNCRTVCDHPRNLSDEMIKRLAAQGGVVCVTTVPAYTTQEFKDARDAAVKKARVDPPSVPIPEDLDERAKQKRLAPAVMPDMPLPALDDVLVHVDYIINLVGPDHVGIGHDFSVLYPGPEGLEDVSKYTNLTRRLLAKGYTPEDIKKILGGNLLRVWRQVTE